MSSQLNAMLQKVASPAQQPAKASFDTNSLEELAKFAKVEPASSDHAQAQHSAPPPPPSQAPPPPPPEPQPPAPPAPAQSAQDPSSQSTTKTQVDNSTPAPAQPRNTALEAPKFTVGEKVHFYSSSRSKWYRTTVLAVNLFIDGTIHSYDLVGKKNALVEHLKKITDETDDTGGESTTKPKSQPNDAEKQQEPEPTAESAAPPPPQDTQPPAAAPAPPPAPAPAPPPTSQIDLDGPPPMPAASSSQVRTQAPKGDQAVPRQRSVPASTDTHKAARSTAIASQPGTLVDLTESTAGDDPGKSEASKKRKKSPERVERNVESRPAEQSAIESNVQKRPAETDAPLESNVQSRPADATAGGDEALFEVGQDIEYFSGTINDYMRTKVLACRMHKTKGFVYDLACKKDVLQDKLRMCQKKEKEVKKKKKEKGTRT